MSKLLLGTIAVLALMTQANAAPIPRPHVRMLIRVIGPNFVAGVVLDAEGEAVCKRRRF